MLEQETRDRDIIRRRRVLAIVIVVAFAGISLSLNGWEYSPVKWLLEIDKVTEGTYTAGDPYGEWVYSYCNGGEQQVVILRNNHLLGADAWNSLSGKRVPARCDLPLVDHPNLDSWNDQLARLHNLTASNTASAEDVLHAAVALPLSSFYLKPVSDWLKADPEHALAFVDAVSATKLDFENEYPAYEQTREDNFAAIMDLAFEQTAGVDVEVERIDRWLASSLLDNHRGTLSRLASSKDVSPTSKARLLENLDDIDASQRRTVYLDLALPLLAEPHYAPLLAEQIEELPRQERLGVVRQMLAHEHSNPAFNEALLREFDDIFYGDAEELDAFIVIANHIKDDSDSPRILATALDQLSDLERRKAAVHLVSLDSANSERFTLNVLYQFDELHALSKPKVMDAILVSPQFQLESVQEASLDAIQFEMERVSRRDYLSKMLRHQGLAEDVESRIRIALND